MNTFVHIFESYGFPGLILFGIGVVLYYFIKYYGNQLTENMRSGLEKVGENLSDQMSKQNDLLTRTIIEQEDKLITYLINEKKNEQSRHSNMIHDKEDLAVDINNYLKVIKNVHQAQRTYILEFHNHNENLSGTPFVKFTCKYEWFDLSSGYEPLLGICKDMAFASIAQVFKDVRLSPDQCMTYTDMDNFGNNNPSLAYYIVKPSTKTLVFKGLYDKNNTFIAVLVIEYDHTIKEKDINLNKLSVQAAEITQLINLRYKYVE